ncbi:MAG: DUF4912 domain-containing protein [Gemmataceae bacterium]|nr:DUF4912 domain-containing protein [Gemmataceae bacterium]
MSKATPLSRRPKVELERMARRRGIRGWETMTKTALVAALLKVTGGSKKGRVTVKSAAKVTTPRRTSSSQRRASGAGSASTASAKSRRVASRHKSTPAPASRSGKKTATNDRVPETAAPPRLGKTLAPAGEKSREPAQSTAGKMKKTASPTGGVDKGQAVDLAGGGGSKLAAVVSRPSSGGIASATVAVPPRVSTPPAKDRVILTVNDPYWLHVMWELSAQSVQRAEAALKQDWYGAKLTIRLWDVTSQDTTSTYETPLQDIPVEEDGHNWYIHVSQPPRTYRVDIGYMSRRGEFFVLARSNVVTTPKAGTPEALDAGWETDPRKAERIAAMSTGFESAAHPQLKAIFEERFRRPIGSPRESAFGSGATPPHHLKKFYFDLDARLIVFGRTDPQAHLTLGNDPVELRPDGTFVMEFSLPDSRQIIPAVAVSADGVEERTIVLAIERNTKYLEPIIHDQISEN